MSQVNTQNTTPTYHNFCNTMIAVVMYRNVNEYGRDVSAKAEPYFPFEFFIIRVCLLTSSLMRNYIIAPLHYISSSPFITSYYFKLFVLVIPPHQSSSPPSSSITPPSPLPLTFVVQLRHGSPVQLKPTFKYIAFPSGRPGGAPQSLAAAKAQIDRLGTAGLSDFQLLLYLSTQLDKVSDGVMV